MRRPGGEQELPPAPAAAAIVKLNPHAETALAMCMEEQKQVGGPKAEEQKQVGWPKAGNRWHCPPAARRPTAAANRRRPTAAAAQATLAAIQVKLADDDTYQMHSALMELQQVLEAYGVRYLGLAPHLIDAGHAAASGTPCDEEQLWVVAGDLYYAGSIGSSVAPAVFDDQLRRNLSLSELSINITCLGAASCAELRRLLGRLHRQPVALAVSQARDVAAFLSPLPGEWAAREGADPVSCMPAHSARLPLCLLLSCPPPCSQGLGAQLPQPRPGTHWHRAAAGPARGGQAQHRLAGQGRRGGAHHGPGCPARECWLGWVEAGGHLQLSSA